MHVSVEGNVGVGKTSVVRELQALYPHASVVEEPVSEWERRGLLQRMYEAPERSAASFQMAALVGLFEAQYPHSRAPLLITERSMQSNMQVFAKLNLDKHDFDMYRYAYDSLAAVAAPRADHVIVYLHAPTAVLVERVRRRGRPAEKHIDAAYLERVEDAHDAWLSEVPDVLRLDVTTSTPKETARLIGAEIASRVLRRQSADGAA